MCSLSGWFSAHMEVLWPIFNGATVFPVGEEKNRFLRGSRGRKDSFGVNALEKLDPQGWVSTNYWFSSLVISHVRKTCHRGWPLTARMRGMVFRKQFYFPWTLWTHRISWQPGSQQCRDEASPSSNQCGLVFSFSLMRFACRLCRGSRSLVWSGLTAPGRRSN